MIGVELKEKVAPHLRGLMERGVLALAAGATVLRFLPPLTISRDEVDTVLAEVAAVLGAERVAEIMKRTRILEALNRSQATEAAPGKGLGAHPARRQGPVVSGIERRLVPEEPAGDRGRRNSPAAEVSGYGHHRRRGRSPGGAGRLARQEPASGKYTLPPCGYWAAPMRMPTRCRRNATPTSFCAPSPTCARAPTSTAPCSAFVPKRPSRCTSSSASAASTSCTPPS